jgi:hypothetical protein
LETNTNTSWDLKNINLYLLLRVWFLCRLYEEVATYRGHFSVVCLSVRHKTFPYYYPNCTGMISTKSCCAYRQHFSVQWFYDFCQSYGPSIFFIFFILKFVRTISLIPLMQFQWNFTGLLCSLSLCAFFWFSGWMIFGRVMALE